MGSCQRAGCRRPVSPPEIVCSPECAAALAKDCREVLAILNGERPVSSMSPHLRAHGLGPKVVDDDDGEQRQ